MKRIHIRILTLAAVVAAIVWGVFAKAPSSQAGEAQPAGKRNSKATLVTVDQIEPSTLRDTLTTIGTLTAEEKIVVRNEVAGKLVAINFEEGQAVHEGDVLARMRTDVLRANLRVSQQRQKLLEKQLDRQQKVLARGGVSQQKVDQTANQLAVSRAEEQRVRAKIDQTVVRAPFDGVIGIREVSRGAILSTASRIATLRKLDRLDVDFTVAERYARRIHTGQQVGFRVHGSDDIRRAEVVAIEPGLDPDDRSLRVQARTDNTDGGLRAGAFAQVRVLLKTIDAALTVPSPAVVMSGQQAHVWVDVDGLAKKRTVQTGYRTESSVEIVDGLAAGDRVIVTGHQSLQPGKPVKVDTSEDAMDVDDISPGDDRQGMRHRWFSEKTLKDPADSSESSSTAESHSHRDAEEPQ